MEFPFSFDKIDTEDFRDFKELIQMLNSNHNIELLDTDKYLFQALYIQIFNKIKDSSISDNFAEISNQVREIFPSELLKINEDNQNRFEFVSSNSDKKAKLIDILAKLVYHHLGNKTRSKKAL